MKEFERFVKFDKIEDVVSILSFLFNNNFNVEDIIIALSPYTVK